MFARRLCSVLSCVAAAACSGTSSVDQSQYLAQYSAALCTKVANCCPTEAADAGFTVAACETKEIAAASAGFAALLATGHVTYNGAAAASCNSEIASVSCGALAGAGGPADCALAVVGTQPIGAACSSGNECTSDFCNNVTVDNNGHVTAPGACAAQAAANQPCPEPSNGMGSSGQHCAAGTVNVFSGGNCTCAPTVANGADCTVNSEYLCTSGYCDPATTKCATVPADLTVQECTGAIANF